jgi:hypothetical protein
MFKVWHQMQVSGELLAAAALPPGKGPTNPLIAKLIGHQANYMTAFMQFKCLSSYWCFGKEIIYGTCNAIY